MSDNEYGGYSPPISSPTRYSKSHRRSSPPFLDYFRRNSSPTCLNYEIASSSIYKNRCDTTTLNITSNPLVHFDGEYAIHAPKYQYGKYISINQYFNCFWNNKGYSKILMLCINWFLDTKSLSQYYKTKCRQEYKERCTNKVTYQAPNKRIATLDSSNLNEKNISNTSSYEPWCERLWMYAVVVIVWITLLLIGVFIVYLYVHGISSVLLSIPVILDALSIIWYIFVFIVLCVPFTALMFFVVAMCCYLCLAASAKFNS